MRSKSPAFVVLAGPNGSGKTTCARGLIPPGVSFINADEIARELPLEGGSNPDMAASRQLLKKIAECVLEKKEFAIETTLASRSLVGRIRELRDSGYQTHLIFLWLRSVDLAIDRVMERVRRGGHSIPSTVIRRRYHAGLHNFFHLYKNIVDSWMFYDNSVVGCPSLIAVREQKNGEIIKIQDLWKPILETIKNEEKEV